MTGVLVHTEWLLTTPAHWVLLKNISGHFALAATSPHHTSVSLVLNLWHSAAQVPAERSPPAPGALGQPPTSCVLTGGKSSPSPPNEAPMLLNQGLTPMTSADPSHLLKAPSPIQPHCSQNSTTCIWEYDAAIVPCGQHTLLGLPSGRGHSQLLRAPSPGFQHQEIPVRQEMEGSSVGPKGQPG